MTSRRRGRPLVALVALVALACLGAAPSVAADEVDDLLEVVRRGSAGERSRALSRLGFLGSDRAVTVLARGLGAADPEVRMAACRDLADLGALGAFPHLARALGDPEPSVRREAALGLGAVRDRRAVDPLARLMRDEESGVREAAVIALGRIGGPATERVLAARAGVETEPAVLVALAGALGASGGDVARRGLRTLVGSSDAQVAAAAAMALAPHGDPAAQEALLARVASDDPAARARAALALAHPAYRGATSHLADLLLRDTDDELRAAAATALTAQGDPRGLRYLVAGATAGTESQRVACTEALDRMHVPEERREQIAAHLLDFPPYELR